MAIRLSREERAAVPSRVALRLPSLSPEFINEADAPTGLTRKSAVDATWSMAG